MSLFKTVGLLIMKKVTFVLTSCGRNDLLEKNARFFL